MVTKTTKDVITWRWLFGDTHITVSGSCGPLSCNFAYRRIPDIQVPGLQRAGSVMLLQGKWSLVTKQGVEAQLEALGITGPEQRRRAPTYLPACVVGSGPPSVTALSAPGYPASGGWQLALGHGGGQP